MTFDDRMTIRTPEGVDLDVVLAGLGSRFTAALLDSLIQAAIGALLGLALALGGAGGGFAIAAFFVLLFLLIFGYDVLFETLNSGRTPGKAAAGIRVRRATGQPVGFRASAVRNLLRLVDGFSLASFPLAPVGMVSILATRYNQRLGDLAAATVVIREPKPTFRHPPTVLSPWNPLATTGAPLDWDVSGVSASDVATIREYLARRVSLSPAARVQIAQELASRLSTRIAGTPEGCHPEVLLEGIVAAKDARG